MFKKYLSAFNHQTAQQLQTIKMFLVKITFILFPYSYRRLNIKENLHKVHLILLLCYYQLKAAIIFRIFLVLLF